MKASWRKKRQRLAICILAAVLLTLACSFGMFVFVPAGTGGKFGTEVIANQFYVQMFRSYQYGRGAAIAIVLLIAVLPVMWYNLRQFSRQTEAFR